MGARGAIWAHIQIIPHICVGTLTYSVSSRIDRRVYRMSTSLVNQQTHTLIYVRPPYGLHFENMVRTAMVVQVSSCILSLQLKSQTIII